MKPLGTVRRALAAVTLLGLAVAAFPLAAQADSRLTVGKIKDSRRLTGSGEASGEMLIFPTWEGKDVDAAKAFRISVASARDDTGAGLLTGEPWTSGWESMKGSPDLWIRLKSPARGAATVTVAGSISLYVPERDPDAELKVPNALARPGKAIASKGLKDAKVEMFLATKDEMTGSSIILHAREADMAKVYFVRVLRADGTELPVASSRTGTFRKNSGLEIVFTEPVPSDAVLVFVFQTEKTILTVPFELRDVPLP